MKKIVFLLSLIVNIVGGNFIKAQGYSSEGYTACGTTRTEYLGIDASCVESYVTYYLTYDCNTGIISHAEDVEFTQMNMDCQIQANTDCNGDYGGTAYLDNCSECVGGNTQRTSSCDGGVTYDNGGSGGGGGGVGEMSNSSTTQSSVDCTGSTAEQNATNALNVKSEIFLDKNIALNGTTIDNRSNNISTLDLWAVGLNYEVGYYAKQYDYNGSYCVSDMVTQNSATSIKFEDQTQSVVATFHTHPEGDPANPNLTGPSPGDFLMTIEEVSWTQNAANGTGFTDSYIYAYNGAQYSLHVEDKQKALAFMASHPELFTTTGLQNNAGSWATNSDLYNTYYEFYKAALSTVGANNAHDYAMAAIMEKAGISLLKKDMTGDHFREMSATQTTLSNGQKTYSLQKCR